VDDHRKQESYKLEPQCFIDAFLKEIDKNAQSKDQTHFTGSTAQLLFFQNVKIPLK